jgi:hypothetical protein
VLVREVHRREPWRERFDVQSQLLAITPQKVEDMDAGGGDAGAPDASNNGDGGGASSGGDPGSAQG